MSSSLSSYNNYIIVWIRDDFGFTIYLFFYRAYRTYSELEYHQNEFTISFSIEKYIRSFQKITKLRVSNRVEYDI